MRSFRPSPLLVSEFPDLFDDPVHGPMESGREAAIPVRSDLAPPWQPSLTHRLRVLLHTAPLHDLRLGDSRRDPEIRHYDTLALAIKVFDLVVDHAGLDREVERAAVERSLAPLLASMDAAAGKAPDAVRHAAIVDRVLAGLRNDDAGRRPFEITYRDFDEGGEAVSRRLEFRLLVDHFHPAGGTVLRLSNEAVNLYLNALELDIEDAQAAAEAVVASQLARGRLDEAVQSARNARWQSLRYQEKVTGIMRETRRDVSRLDWREEIPRLLGEALEHIRIRIQTEENILEVAEQRLDVLEPGDGAGRTIGEVARLVRECRERHVDLHDQLMRVRNVFLDEHARQAFNPAPLLPRPELLGQVLEPVLRMGRGNAREVTDHAFPGFFGARAPSMLALVDLVEWQLRPRREPPASEVPVDERDLTLHAVELGRYPPEVRERAEALLVGLDGPTTLGALLDAGQRDGIDDQILELVVLLALHQFAPEETDVVPVAVERRHGALLDTAGFFGNELDLRPIESMEDGG